MQVAKLVKSDQIDLLERKRVCKAVGFSFINRLIATGRQDLIPILQAHVQFDQ